MKCKAKFTVSGVEPHARNCLYGTVEDSDLQNMNRMYKLHNLIIY